VHLRTVPGLIAAAPEHVMILALRVQVSLSGEYG
jgi:hypothetical protein